MTPKLPALKPKQVIRALSKAGFFVDHQTGSHVIMYKDDYSLPVSIPYHNRDLKKGTLRNILRQAELTEAAFIRCL